MALLGGACARTITPQGSVFLVGYPHVQRMSTGVHDPLTVSTVVLHGDGGTCVLASLDLLFLSPATAAALRGSVASRLGLRPEAVFVGCTHTHSGPVTNRVLAWRSDPVVPAPDPRYMERLEQEILLAAGEAHSRLGPVEVAFASASARGVGGNRLDPGGPADPKAGVLVVRRRADHRPLALVLSYAMHPTVLHEDSTLVSADFPGSTRRFLASRFAGDDLTVVYFTGTAGNQSPRHVVPANTFAEAERLGALLGDSVARAVDDLSQETFDPGADIRASLAHVPLPLRRFPPPEEAERILRSSRETYESLKRAGAARADVRTAECAVFGAEETVTLASAQATGELEAWMRAYTPAAVQVVRVGATCLVGLPGELYVEYGLELKRRAPAATMVASLVNGDLQGYIVTPDAVRAGTYEALNSVFEPEAGGRLLDAALGLMR